ncbi:MAG TPA: 4Fe-4S dicluster domain-containing protein [Thermoanaerobaculales bacterium]|nr:4Fe-4S dicluster domain-containing protein [Thermoanaerobaculales bacterium]HPA80001.1 4Fe-4S dicluster domain-containing protein [Thermoanaerobaculales bacterium]HQL31077.1 4Fe-4S dicluster domain-containing protein [Thermoanaerobaculales bacterium]HQN94823.1 4Fe-4S dicluster domain-containing protein [Thermoanaerobaculales bacterium]HQP44809.1 4Fe-4S dicluster domain-containing protein [Thermoanaerobaculales bacterium]
MPTDRREFLIGSGRVLLIASGAAAGALKWVLAGAPEQAPGYDVEGHWWAMAIDIGRCIGCGNCVRACKAENDVPLEPLYFRTWVERYQLPEGDTDRPHVDSPNGGYDGFPERDEPGAGSKDFFVPKLCNQCAHSPCVQVCPVGATFVSPDGVVLVDTTYCLGCRYCVQACPYGSRFIDPRSQTVDKCTLCYHRITRGLTTACCEVCPTGARALGDLKNPSDPIHGFLREHAVHVLKPQMATGAKVFYAGLDGSVR